MKRHFFTPIFRNIFRQHQQAFLTLGSLLLGIGSVVITSAFIQQGDAAQKQPERVFRVCKWITAADGSRTQSVKTAGLLAPTLNKGVSGAIECSARYMKWPEQVGVTNFDKHIPTKKWAFADPAILEIFSVKTLKGNARAAMEKPGQLILTDRYAKSIFGAANPIGQTIMGLGGKLYTVAAIVEQPAGHSALQFDVLASWTSTMEESGIIAFPFLHNWTAQVAETFIRLEDSLQKNAVEESILQMLKKSPHPSGSTDLFLEALSGSGARTGANENAEQDRFGARVSSPANQMILVPGSRIL